MARKVQTCSICLVKAIWEYIDKKALQWDVSRSKAIAIIIKNYMDNERG